MARGLIRRNHHLHHWHPLHLSSSEEKIAIQSTRAKNIRGREKSSDDGLPIPKYFLFVDAKTEPRRIQIFHIYRDGFESRIFWHFRSTRFDSILPHNLVHYEFKIWIINYPVVFTSFQRETRVLRGSDQDLSDYKRLNFLSQNILSNDPSV